MRANKITSVLFSVLFGLLMGCGGEKGSGENEVILAETNFESGTIGKFQNLLFTFNKDIGPDSLLGLWDTTQYLKISPEVKGKFKWSSPTDLVFSPDHGFKPSSDYTVTVTDSVLKFAPKDFFLVEKPTLKFHTPYLNLETVETAWVLNRETRSTKLRFNMVFNLKVNPEKVSKLLTIKYDGKSLKYNILANSNTTAVDVEIDPVKDKNFEGGDIKLDVAEGLDCEESKYKTKEAFEYTIKVPYKSKFNITNVTSRYENGKGYVEVHTNQTIDRQNLQSLVRFSPSVSFTVEADEFGMIIEGSFKQGETYEMTINKKLRGIFEDAVLGKDHEQYVTFGELQPSISFESKGAIYLTSAGQKNLAMRITSIPKVQVKIIKIYENNIYQFLKRSGGYNGYYHDDYYYDDYYYGGGNDDYEDLGDVVYDKEVSTNNLPKTGGGIRLLNLDFDDINQYKGLFFVKVSSTEDRWLKATNTVAISDVGMIIKETENDIHVFANSILNATPIEGADVRLISSNNQSVYTVKTDHNGIAKFSDLPANAKDFKISMVTARHKGDFTYVNFRQTRVDRSRFEIGGVRMNSAGYQAFLYGDRNLYRPGEKIYTNCIVRDSRWGVVKDIPVKMRLLYPNGKEFKSVKGQLNSQGAFETSFQLSQSNVTGTYTQELFTSNDVLLASKYISVEEFMPDRIRVTTNLNKDRYRVGDQMVIQAQAFNMFGPPATNRNYGMELQMNRAYFSPKGFNDYTFSLNDTRTSFERRNMDGKTDNDGKAEERYTIPSRYSNSGLLSGTVFTTVFDESGRPVNRRNTFEVVTQDVFYGIKYTDYYVATNKDLKIPVVAVDVDGNTQNGVKGNVQIIKYEWHTILEKNHHGKYRYVSRKKEKLVYDKTISISGKQSFVKFNPSTSGTYVIRLKKPGTSAYVQRYFYAYRWGSTDNNSFEVDKDGEINIEFDKEAYTVGDQAKVLLKNPFNGRLLVTIERDGVYEHQYLETDSKAAEYTFKVKEEYLPNAFITATLIKPHSNGAIPLTVAHGYKSFKVEDRDYHEIPLKITAPKKSRSKTKQTICVQSRAESDIEVTIAVVDEGILQIKNYQSPDPYEFFFQKRALQVNSYDIYPRLYPELTMNTQSFGSGDYDLEKRVNPMTNKRVKLVAFWSGILKTDKNGKVCYDVDIPQFSGDLRIMAVAYKGKAFGSASTNMKVADPMVVTTSLPRFLSPKDTVEVPVLLTNTTDKSTKATARLNVSGPLEIIGSTTQTQDVPANSERSVRFKLFARPQIGEGKIVTVVSALNEKFSEENDITIRPGTSLLKENGAGIISAGNSETIDLGNDYIPSSADARLVVSKSPMVQFTEDLEYLVGYPHGCVEQTTSKAFPQLYFHDVMKSIGVKQMVGSNPRYNVQQAVLKLQSMQLYSGGLSYWPGGHYVSSWGSIYASHFLYEARKAGYDVDPRVLEKLWGYLKNEAKRRRNITYEYYDVNGVLRKKTIIPKETPYALYVLALAGEQDVATMNYIKNNLDKLSLDSKYLLAGAYKLIGDNTSYNSILPREFSGERSMKVTGGSFHSFIRDEAIALNALIEVDPKNPQIAQMTRHLTKQMKQSRYLSTQERSFAMLALGKLAAKANRSNITATITADGRTVGNFNGKNLIIDEGLAGKGVKISTSGSGDLYYFWEIEGISKTGRYLQEDKVLRVRKSFYDRDGNLLQRRTFTQNEMIVVRIDVETIDGSRLENVAITDMLPAGFEIENPRLTSIPGTSWIRGASHPQHFDIRDDRINLFTDVSGHTKKFYYMVRAVSMGDFQMGPVGADAMYNGEYHSYHGAGTVRVVDKY